MWVIVGFMRTNIANTQNRPLCYVEISECHILLFTKAKNSIIMIMPNKT